MSGRPRPGCPDAGRGHDGGGDGVVALGLHRRSQRQHLLGLGAGRSGDEGHLGMALGEGARLVEHHAVHLGQPLERFAAADEDAQGRGPAAPDHHGHRRGQAHGARTGHQQHGQAAQDGLAQVADQQPPGQEGDGGAEQDRRDEDAADPVGHALQRGLVPLGVVDQALQSGEHRLGGHRGHPHHQDAASVDRSRR